MINVSLKIKISRGPFLNKISKKQDKKMYIKQKVEFATSWIPDSSKDLPRSMISPKRKRKKYR